MEQAIHDIREASDDIAKDLAGFATRVAVAQLTTNWCDAYFDGNKEFTAAAAANDIDLVIANLTKLKLRLTDEPDANCVMRQALGI